MSTSVEYQSDLGKLNGLTAVLAGAKIYFHGFLLSNFLIPS